MAESVDIARTLRDRRRALGLTRARLAEQTGAEVADLSRWERGEAIPPPESILALAEAIELDVEEAQAWLDEADVESAERDELGGEGDEVSSDPFSVASQRARKETGLLGRIADRLARRDDRTASVTPIHTPPSPRPSPSTATGLVRAPRPTRQAPRLPSVFPDPAFAPYDPATHIYSAGPLIRPTEEEQRVYLLRRVRTAAVLIGLGLLLWWAAGSLWEGIGDAMDLFMRPATGS